MSMVAPFAYDDDGGLYVCADGPEIYAYTDDEDAPVWKQFCDGIVVAVGVAARTAYTVDTDGGFRAWRGADGEQQGSADLGEPAHALDAHRSGLAAVVIDSGLAIVRTNGEATKLPLAGASAVAFSGDGQQALAGTSQGDVVLYDLTTGGQVATASVGAPVAAIDWAAPSEWVVAAGSNLVFLAADLGLAAAGEEQAPQPVNRTVDVDGAPRTVAANHDGVIVACDDGEQMVLIFETHEYRQTGHVEYNRPVGQLDFGPGTLLGIGLEYADANRLDVMSAKIVRNQPGLGKANDPWFPKVKVDTHLLRGAVASKRAGGGPIADVRQVQQSRFGGGGAEGGTNWLLIGGIVAGVSFLCCGGVGAALAVWQFVLS